MLVEGSPRSLFINKEYGAPTQYVKCHGWSWWTLVLSPRRWHDGCRGLVSCEPEMTIFGGRVELVRISWLDLTEKLRDLTVTRYPWQVAGLKTAYWGGTWDRSQAISPYTNLRLDSCWPVGRLQILATDNWLRSGNSVLHIKQTITLQIFQQNRVSGRSVMMFGVRASCLFRANWAVCLMDWDPLFYERPFAFPPRPQLFNLPSPAFPHSVSYSSHTQRCKVDQVEISSTRFNFLSAEADTECFRQLPSLTEAVTLVTGT